MRTFWRVLLGLSFAGLLACAGAWFVLLFNICSNPHTPSAATQNTIPYSCHGTIVFLTPVEQFLLEWLGPIGVFFMVASFILLAWVLHMRRIDESGADQLNRPLNGNGDEHASPMR